MMRSTASRAPGRRSGESRSIPRMSMTPAISHISMAPTTVSPLAMG